MHCLQNRISEDPLDIIAITEMWDNSELKDAELTVPGYNLFRKDRSDGLLGGGVLLMIRDTNAAVLSSLPVVGSHDILACGIGPPGSAITICVVCKHRDTNVEQDLPLSNLLTTMFDVP